MKKESSEHNEDFYRHLKQKVEGFESDFKAEHWALMQTKLKKNKNHKRILWVLFLICPIALFSYWIIYPLLLSPSRNINLIETKKEIKPKPIENQLIAKNEARKDSSHKPLGKILNYSNQRDTSSFLITSSTDTILFGNLTRTNFNIEKIDNHLFINPSQNQKSNIKIDKSLLINDLENDIRSFVFNQTINDDSISYKVFERNRHTWKNVVVVCDWTSSMFEYGTQIMTWLDHHIDNPNIKGFVFFNDCDSLGNPLPSHHTKGKMYLSRTTERNQVLNTMLEAARKGIENDDVPENDLEALLFAIKAFPNAEEFILIADNKSTVKDDYLLKKIQKPIRIIPCGGIDKNKQPLPIQPIYLALAYHTKGSVHTVNEDFLDWTKVLPKKINKILGHNYLFKNGEFKIKN